MVEHFDEALRDLEEGARPPEEGLGVGREAADFDAHPSVAALKAAFGDAVLRHDVMAGDESVVFVQPDRLLEIMRFLKDDAEQRFDLLKDVTAVDFGGGRPLQVVYELWSIPNRRQLRVKAELALDALEVDSVQPLWKTADWLERECYDMFGIQFRGHPDLRRILMPENYAEGHPLRKDFPLRGRFTRAEQTRNALSMDVEDYYIPEELRFAEPGAGAEAGAGVLSPPEGEAATSSEAGPAETDAAEEERP